MPINQFINKSQIHGLISSALALTIVSALVSDIVMHLGLIAIIFLAVIAGAVQPAKREVKLMAFALVAFSSYGIANTLFVGDFIPRHLENNLRILALSFLMLRLNQIGYVPNKRILAFSALIALVLAACLSTFEVALLKIGRAELNQHPIMLGNMALLLSLIGIVGSDRFTIRLQWILKSAFFVLAAYIILLSGSRGPLLALFVTWFFYAALLLNKKQINSKRKKLLTVSIAAVIVIVGLGAVVSGIASRTLTDVQMALSGSTEGSVSTRIEMWKAATDAFLQKPLLGVGNDLRDTYNEGGEHLQYSSIVLNWGHAHNEILDIAARRGFIGLVTFFGLLLAPIFIFRQVRPITYPLLISVAWFSAGMTQSLMAHMIGATFIPFTYMIFTLAAVQTTTPCHSNAVQSKAWTEKSPYTRLVMGASAAVLFCAGSYYGISNSQSKGTSAFETSQINQVKLYGIEEQLIIDLPCDMLGESPSFFVHLGDGNKSWQADFESDSIRAQPNKLNSDFCQILTQVKDLPNAKNIRIGQHYNNVKLWDRSYQIK